MAKWLGEAVFFSIGFHPVLRYYQKPSSQKHYESTIWYQNKFISQATVEDFFENRPVDFPELKDKIFGVAATVTGRLKLKGHVSLFGEIGGKTKGYLPGYPLDASVVGRVGFWYGACP